MIRISGNAVRMNAGNERGTADECAKRVVTPARFERATFPLGGGRSIQLSYGAIGSWEGYRVWLNGPSHVQSTRVPASLFCPPPPHYHPTFAT